MENEGETYTECVFRYACEVASELPGLDKYRNCDEAFVHHVAELEAQAGIFLAHCKDESVREQVRAGRDCMGHVRREWRETEVLTWFILYVQGGADLNNLPWDYAMLLATYLQLLGGVRLIKMHFRHHLLELRNEAISDEFQQLRQDINILQNTTEAASAGRPLAVGEPAESRSRSIMERFGNLIEETEKLFAIQNDPDAIAKLLLSIVPVAPAAA